MVTTRGVAGVPWADAGLAAVLLAISVGSIGGDEWHSPRAANYAVVLPAAAFVALRRRAPYVAMAVPQLALSGLWLTYEGAQTWAYLFIQIVVAYSVAAYVPDIRVAAASVVASVVVHSARTPETQIGSWVWELGVFGVAFGLGLATRRRQEREGTLVSQQQALEREQTRVAEAAAVEERLRIARELHDIISHSLAVMVLQAGAAESVLDKNPTAARAALASIRTTGQEAIGEMETLIGLARDETGRAREPQPSIDSIAELAANLRAAGLGVEVERNGLERPLPAAVGVSAYRIVQEALTNVLKHAGQANVRIRLHYRDDALDIEVVDDGQANGTTSGGQRGLAGMRERVAIFDGRLETGPRPDGGWRVAATLPLGR